jgi:hypothetical protein
MSSDILEYKRIVYSPEVQVYILPSSSNQPIDISNDIIEGSITRRSEAVSTASFVVQSRRKSNNKITLSEILRPMDRIVIYLKKVKPILIFSGYLDMVPLFQAVPEPFVIEASCTLKRLEFTYWDPGLPQVYETLIKYGFQPGFEGGGISFFTPPGNNPTQSGPQAAEGDFPQDTGFATMLHFLLTDVGGWKPDNVWIEPIPEAWMQRAALLFQVRNDWEDRYNTAQEWLRTFLTSGGSGSGSSGDGSKANSATLANPDEIKAKIDQMIQKHKKGNTDVTGSDFVKYGQQYNIDPRFLAAVACAETHYGTRGQGREPPLGYYNMYGLGNSGRAMSSRAESIKQSSIQLREENFYLGDDPGQTITGWIVNWTNNSQSHLENVKRYWKEMETTNGKVDFNKPYSIVDQEIGTEGDTFGFAGVASKRALVNAATQGTTTGGSNKVLSVYLEAGHAGAETDKAQPGFQLEGGTLKVGGVSGPNEDSGEKQQNVAFVKAIQRVYNALSEEEKSRISINFATGTSRPRGWAGDVYISIHHDPGTYGGSQVGIAYPSTKSLQNSDSKAPGGKKGEPGPNRYLSSGSGFKMPSSGEGGRDKINDDTNLHHNSAQMTRILGDTLSKNQDNKNNTATGSKSPRMDNYYGFYYTNSAAALICELPSSSGALNYDRDFLAKNFVRALLKYQKEIKSKGKQKQVKAGTVGAGGGDPDAEYNAKVEDFIAICRKAAQVNEEKRNMKYSQTDRNLGKKLSECIEKGLSMDCSSYIYNGMVDAGIMDTPTGTFTGSLYDESEKLGEVTKEAAEPGMLLIKGGSTGFGNDGHVVLVSSSDGECVHCTTTSIAGPQFTKIDNYINSEYELCKHNATGTGTGGGGGGADPFFQAKSVAFNIAFNFPGSLLESVLLTGERSLENDVKLFESVAEVCKASMRTFASLPNGDFIAWYPDYFNLTKRNPWVRISPTEIKSCTISLSDRQLVTHVYVLGNPYGFNQADGSRINLEWYEKLLGAGVVTIERPWVLDSFLRPFESEDIAANDNLEGYTNLTEEEKAKAKKRPRAILEGQGSVYKFLEKYGARPYLEKIPTIRHPIFEFFYAYHTFIQKWAEQFVSRVELTFMPELFPGMIVELSGLDRQYQREGEESVGVSNVTFYVQEVTHNFSYEAGFTTDVILIAPGTENNSNHWAMTLVSSPDNQNKNKFRIKKNATPKPKATKKGGSNPKTSNENSSTGTPGIDVTDGEE